MTDDRRVLMRAMAALVLGIIVASLDGTMIATALPVIVGDLGGLDQLPLVISVYMLTSTIVLPLYGRWSDSLGRKPLLILAQLFFALGGLFASTATTMGQLIGWRALQGVGAGGLMVLAQTIVGDMVPAERRSKYLGWIAALFAVGSIAGPLVGGLVADNLGWPWVFRFVFFVGLVGVVATLSFIPNMKQEAAVDPDIGGSLLLAVTLSSAVLVATLGGTVLDWTSPTIIVLSLVLVISVIALIEVERHRDDGVLPVTFFRRPGVTAGMIVAMVTGATIFGFIVFIPVYVQLGLGASATTSGLATLPLMLAFMLGSVLVGRSIARHGNYRLFPIVGTALIAVSLLLLATMSSTTSLLVLGLYLVIGGFGVSMVMQVVVLAMQTTVPDSQLGTATSMAQLFRSIGGVLGIAALGSLLTARLQIELSNTGLEAAGVDPNSIIETPALAMELSEAMQLAVRDAATASVTFVFAISVPITLVALVAALRLPDRKIYEPVT